MQVCAVLVIICYGGIFEYLEMNGRAFYSSVVLIWRKTFVLPIMELYSEVSNQFSLVQYFFTLINLSWLGITKAKK